MALPSLQRRLTDGETLIAYVLTEPTSFCLVIDRSSVSLVELASAKAANAAADRFISELRAGRSDAARLDLTSALVTPSVSTPMSPGSSSFLTGSFTEFHSTFCSQQTVTPAQP